MSDGNEAPLRWELELAEGRLVVSAQRAGQALQGLQGDLNRTGAAVITLNANMGKLSDGAKGAHGGITDLAAGAHLAREAVHLLAEAVKTAYELIDKFGDKAISAFNERQSSLRAYTALLGDSTKATQEFGKAQQLALLTPFLSSQIESAQKQFFVAGLRNDDANKATGRSGQADRALLALSDYSSLAADKNQSLEKGSQVLSKIKAEGYLDRKHMMELPVDLGVSASILKEEIGKIIGVKDPHGVDKAIAGRQVSYDTFQAALEQTDLRQFGQKRLGSMASGGAQSLEVALVNQGEQVKNLLKTFDAEKELPGVQRYKQALADQASAFNVSTDAGKETVLTLQSFADTSMNLKATWEDFTTGFVESFSKSYNATMETLGLNEDKWKEAGVSATSLGETIGNVGKFAAYGVHALEDLGKALDWLVDQVSGTVRYFKGLWHLSAAEMTVAYGKRWNEKTGELEDDGTEAMEKENKRQAKEYKEIQSALADWGSGSGTGGGPPAPGNPLAAGVQIKKAVQATAHARAGGGRGAGGGEGGGGGSGGGGGGDSHDHITTNHIHVEIIAQHGQSAEEIADLTVMKMVQRLGRHARNPSPARTH